MREFHGYEEMSKEDFKALQEVNLKILLYFDEFCKKHNLRYYLAGGTLIGAVRHKGFIPWDEDIDLHMPRPDYDRLPKLWKQFAETDHYTLCVTTKKKNYRHHAYSICDNKTTMIEHRNINDDIAQGIKLDILPFDGVPANKFLQTKQFFWALIFGVYNVQRLPENQGGSFMRVAVKIALGLVRDPEKRYKLWRHAQYEMSKYDFETSPYVRELVAPLRSMKFIYPRKNFDKPYLLEFEGYKFPAQHYYKNYLENVYTGYMELPPEDKRKPKGDIVYINLDRGYINYKGIYYCKGKE